MNTYAERLAWAMVCRGLSPTNDQSTLAKLVGLPCKPQNIQHLLDPDKNAKSSKYTPRLAEVLHCDVSWLAYGSGKKPVPAAVAEPAGTSLTAKSPNFEAPVYPDFFENPSALQIDVEQIDQFVADLREAFHAERLTPRRFSLLKGLLAEGTENPAVSIENQRIATRGGDGRQKKHRGKTGT
ncbi:hypothetical protein G3N58_15230 [Paraburkholderia sp. Ac-20342]|uniref:hypothetical protein n=1 Tax=Paraburkholderia sp. Ac-20342 TaxID=2703889 RepID=UPI00197DD9D2|nr:hypothetical protein [Paraburkholderia sp. Ac-20342]MBN3848173.1 hypothetical protein [Paraburkholderia sp. Ac-20342]